MSPTIGDDHGKQVQLLGPHRGRSQAAGNGPTGILNTSGINTVATVGTPTNYAEMTTAVKDLLVDNYAGDISGLAWIAHPRDFATYDGLADTTGQF